MDESDLELEFIVNRLNGLINLYEIYYNEGAESYYDSTNHCLKFATQNQSTHKVTEIIFPTFMSIVEFLEDRLEEKGVDIIRQRYSDYKILMEEMGEI